MCVDLVTFLDVSKGHFLHMDMATLRLLYGWMDRPLHNLTTMHTPGMLPVLSSPDVNSQAWHK